MRRSKNDITKKAGDKLEFMKNPLNLAEASADLNLYQRSIMLAIGASLNQKIEMWLNSGNPQPYTLFDTSEIRMDENGEKYVPITFNISDMNISRNRYYDLNASCKNIAQSVMAYTHYERNEQNKVIRKTKVFKPIFHSVEIELDPNSSHDKCTGRITANIRLGSAEQLLNMGRGYVEHVRHIAELCTRQHTPDLYIALSIRKSKEMNANKQLHIRFEFEDLRDKLGVNVYDETGTMVERVEPKYSRLKSRVLEEVISDMKNVADIGHLDFYVESYEEDYGGRKPRGNPDAITFHLRMTDVGKQHALHIKTKALPLKQSATQTSNTTKVVFSEEEDRRYNEAMQLLDPMWREAFKRVVGKDGKAVLMAESKGNLDFIKQQVGVETLQKVCNVSGLTITYKRG